MEIKIIKLEKQDLEYFKNLIIIFEEVFEMDNFKIPPDEHLKRILNKEGFFVFIALQNDNVIGGLTIYTLDQYYSTKPLAYIYDLAIKVEFQRKGIGKQLIKEVTNYCIKKGYEEVFVQADKVDDYALDFYRSTNPTDEEDVSHFYYKFN